MKHACLGLLLAAVSHAAYADYKCERPWLTHVDATACAKAALGATELRRYVWATRMIHNLWMADYVPRQGFPSIASARQRPDVASGDRSIATVPPEPERGS